MLGFMSGCAFISMWVQNVSAVTMVIPIMEAVIQQILKARKEDYTGEENPNLELDGICLHFMSFVVVQSVFLSDSHSCSVCFNR